MASCAHCTPSRWTGKHQPGCPNADPPSRRDPTGPENPGPRRCKPKDHQWVWKRRANPMFGRPYDEYKCSVCGEIDQRPV